VLQQLARFRNCTNFCDYNGLGCLPVANGTTGAQRFLAALSNRPQLRNLIARPTLLKKLGDASSSSSAKPCHARAHHEATH
jgi:hypothetical protein